MPFLGPAALAHHGDHGLWVMVGRGGATASEQVRSAYPAARK